MLKANTNYDMEPKNHLVVKSPLCHNFPQTGEKLNNL